MVMLDKAKHGAAVGQARFMEIQARRQHGRLARQLGEAYYAEKSGQGKHEDVDSAYAALEAHTQTYPPRKARDIMRRGSECVSAEESVGTAAEKMRDLGVSALPICGTDNRLHGMLTEGDIVLKCIAEGRDPAKVRAGDLAQESVVWIEADAPVSEALRRMEDHRVKRLPVIDDHRLVGMITEADIAHSINPLRVAEFVGKVYSAP
ncbi:MAG TPA: CBS domain-containing protein [Streptosporangiaceae bacterium]|nr:CBS domain-containing protein [Streptosporangiaceae bacterium]